VDLLRRYWHPVCKASDIRDKPVPATLLGEQIVLFRHADGISALKNLCIHRGAMLSMGWVSDSTLVCAYHGWQYDKAGRCIGIPSLEEGRPIPTKARTPAYQVAEQYGMVWVCLDDEPALPIPPYPAYDDESMTSILYEEFHWMANAARICENVLDYTHLPWVHEGLLGSREHSVFPLVEAKTFEDGIAYDMPDEANDTVRHYRVYAPFTVMIHVTANNPGGHNYSLMFTCTPVSSRETRQWYFSSRDWDLHRPDHDWAKFDEIVMEQDRVIVEGQRPEELPMDLSEELHLRGSDVGTMAYRRYLRDLGLQWS
jgi:vanillate O-demethylase monooxygenase subunit